MKNYEQNLREMWDTFKYINICIMGVPGKEKERTEKISEERMAENLCNLMKNINLPIRKAQLTPIEKNTK